MNRWIIILKINTVITRFKQQQNFITYVVNFSSDNLTTNIIGMNIPFPVIRHLPIITLSLSFKNNNLLEAVYNSFMVNYSIHSDKWFFFPSLHWKKKKLQLLLLLLNVSYLFSSPTLLPIYLIPTPTSNVCMFINDYSYYYYYYFIIIL